MPIESPDQYRLTFSSIALDMVAQTATVVLMGTLAGKPVNQVSFNVPGSDLLPILAPPAAPGVSRMNDLATVIYEYALANGYAAGTIS